MRTSAETLLPNQATFTGTRVWDANILFWRTEFNPQQNPPWGCSEGSGHNTGRERTAHGDRCLRPPCCLQPGSPDTAPSLALLAAALRTPATSFFLPLPSLLSVRFQLVSSLTPELQLVPRDSLACATHVDPVPCLLLPETLSSGCPESCLYRRLGKCPVRLG